MAAFTTSRECCEFPFTGVYKFLWVFRKINYKLALFIAPCWSLIHIQLKTMTIIQQYPQISISYSNVLFSPSATILSRQNCLYLKTAQPLSKMRCSLCSVVSTFPLGKIHITLASEFWFVEDLPFWQTPRQKANASPLKKARDLIAF